MMSILMLGIPNFSQSFVLEIDASSIGIGVFLIQHQQPMAFFSQALLITHKFKVCEWELRAIVMVVQK